MENKDTTLRLFIGLVIIVLIVAVGLTMNHNKTNVEKAEDSYLTLLQKQDSLQNVIDNLQSELEMQEKFTESLLSKKDIRLRIKLIIKKD
jgi:uncharacterized protein YlxW (UPF0749 family)